MMKVESEETTRQDCEAIEPQSVDAEEIMFGALDAITKRFERTEGFSTMIEPELFNQCATVARLALEWARLETIRGDKKSKPNDYLRAAADLIQDSAKLIAVHPEREKKENDDRWKAKLEGRVGLDKIRGGSAGGVTVKMRDGTFFRFEPFTGASERGFRDFVTKHFARMIKQGLSEIGRNEAGERHTLKEWLLLSLSEKEAGIEAAKHWLRCAGYGMRVNDLERAAQDIGHHVSTFADSVVERWSEIVAEQSAAEKIAEWEVEGIEAVDLRAMAETRARANKDKGSGKRRKAGRLEGTSTKESKARKEQGKTRKKQPRG